MQMQKSVPLRLTILQSLHILLTDARTFILFSVNYPSFSPIRADFHGYPITYHYLYVMQTHFAGKIRQQFRAVIQFNLKLGIRQ